MNLIEAISSGRQWKRVEWTTWHGPHYRVTWDLSPEDIAADDYELKIDEQPISITADHVGALVRMSDDVVTLISAVVPDHVYAGRPATAVLGDGQWIYTNGRNESGRFVKEIIV